MLNSSFAELSPVIQHIIPTCSGDNRYVIRAGDTLYGISKFYNVSPDDLIEANPHLEPDLMQPGQIICIPWVPPPANCPTGASAYVVRKGDTFYSIARSFKMRISSLLKANPSINPDALLIGQSLCIPIITSTFTSEAYKIKLNYPYRWSRIDNDRYAGIDGFLHVSAISTDSDLEKAGDVEAHHKLKPYGTHPVISRTTIDGHEACFIVPSDDQPMEMRCQSAIVAKYVRPPVVNGKSCQYLIVRTDKNHLKDIADTLEFWNE